MCVYIYISRISIEVKISWFSGNLTPQGLNSHKAIMVSNLVSDNTFSGSQVL